LEAAFVSGFFYKMGKMAGPKVRKGKWLWHSLTSSEKEVLAAEYEVGQDLAREIRREMPPVSDPQVGQLFSDIGGRLAGRLSSKKRKFSFELVAGAEPNAFALPGGFIFVTEALWDLCAHDPDEMAFILAHEMAHVVRKHAIDRLISSSAISVLTRAAPVQGVLGGWLRSVGVQFLYNAYSQDRELEADDFGARLVKAAGFDLNAAVRLLARLMRRRPGPGENELGSYFSSHPPLTSRIKYIKRKLNFSG
jgi:predicted Zn-dependent protease